MEDVVIQVVIHLQEIDIVVTAMAGVDVECPGALNFVVCRLFGTFMRFYLRMLLACF